MDEPKWGPTTEGLAILLSVTKPEFKPDEPIILSVALKNKSDAPVPIVVRMPWVVYSLTVRFEGRSEVPKTPYALHLIEVGGLGARATSQLPPGEVTTANVELSAGFDMKRPGSYTVVATRETYKTGKLDEYATVTSNTLTIRVAP